MASKIICYGILMSAILGEVEAKNPVLVDKAGTGDFTTINAAIASFCTGGANATGAGPYVVNIKAGSGPYDEGITLDQEVEGGNINGDIEIKSSVPGSKIVVKLKTFAGAQGGTIGSQDDGLFIFQIEKNVTFRDLVFTRSISESTRIPTDDMVRIDEPVTNSIMNQISFYGCVFTEPKTDGNPMTLDKAGALLPPPARGGGTLSGNACLVQAWGDVGESQRYLFDDCVFYGGAYINGRMRNDGSGEEWTKIHNCLNSYSGTGGNFELGGANPQSKVFITGTDHKSGVLNCTASIFPKAGGHCYLFPSAGRIEGQEISFSNAIAYSEGLAGGNGQNNSSRGISGSITNNTTGAGPLNLTDIIINVPGIGVVDTTRIPSVWTRVTIHNSVSNNAYLFNGPAKAGGTLTISDCIFSGPGTKFSGAPTGGITVKNSAFVTAGPDAIGAKGTITEVANINADPQYVSKNGTIATFMDVQNSAYASAGTSGAALAGGANYVGAPAAVSHWELY